MVTAGNVPDFVNPTSGTTSILILAMFVWNRNFVYFEKYTFSMSLIKSIYLLNYDFECALPFAHPFKCKIGRVLLKMAFFLWCHEIVRLPLKLSMDVSKTSLNREFYKWLLLHLLLRPNVRLIPFNAMSVISWLMISIFCTNLQRRAPLLRSI